MNVQQILEYLNYRLIERGQRPLNPVESVIIDGIYQDRTYRKIAIERGYSEGYLTRVVAPELWRKLSELIGRGVTKKNCRLIIELYLNGERTEKKSSALDPTPIYPSGAVPLHSPYYIDRSPAEEQIEREIRKGGALARIEAPREMGKTSLLLRVLDRAEKGGIRTVNLDFARVDREIFGHLDRFLRWFCTNIARELGLEMRIEDYRDDNIGSKVSCSFFLRDLLARLDRPLVLAYDEVDLLLEYPELARDVLPLLRSWYEGAKHGAIWQKLRQIVVHSHDTYTPLHYHQSPFNVGLPIYLSGFTLDQLNTLAERYGVHWTIDGAKALMALVNGHPSLSHIALYHLSSREITLPRLLGDPSIAAEIYRDHLEHHWRALQREPELMTLFQSLLKSREAIDLEPLRARRLIGTGLIRFDVNGFVIGCDLYRQYFQSFTREMRG
jgi:hypothetical protein